MKPLRERVAAGIGGMWMVLAPAAVVAAGTGIVLFLSRAVETPLAHPPPPPLPAPVVPPRGAREPAAMHLLRSRDEVLVLLKRSDFSLPAADAAVRILDGEGAVLREGRTDGGGVHRASLPGGAAAVEAEWRGATLRGVLPPAPDPLPPDLPFLVDRSVIRPGDRVRLLLLARDGPPPAPRLLLLDGEGGEVEAVALVPGADAAVEEPWALFEGTVPDDAPPGRARFSAGEVLLETLPVVPRYGAPGAAAGGIPDSPPPPGDGALLLRDGQWRLAVPDAEPGTRVLFAALSGDRILDHVVVAVEGGEAAAPLPEASDGRPVAVRAVAMAPDGFRVSEAAAPAARDGARLEIRADPDGEGGAVRLRPAVPAPEEAPGPRAAVAVAADDPSGRRPFTVIAAAASADRLPVAWSSGDERRLRTTTLPGRSGPTSPTRGIPARLRAVAAGGGLTAVLRGAGGLPGGAGRAPRVLHVDRGFLDVGEEGEEGRQSWWRWTAVPVAALLRPGREVPWPGRGRAAVDLPANAPGYAVSWTVDAPPESAGPFRVTAGGSIVLEGLVGPAAGEGPEDGGEDAPGDGRTGTVDGALLARGPLRLEARIPGIRGMLLEGFCLPAPGDAPAAGEGIAVQRILPERGRVDAFLEAVVVLRAAADCGPLEVELPLPGGTVPAEDGGEIRARAPAGTRVAIPRDGEWGVAESVLWRLPGLAAGETRLAVRLRPEAAGDYAAPAATADSLDPAGPWGRSAGGRISVE